MRIFKKALRIISIFILVGMTVRCKESSDKSVDKSPPMEVNTLEIEKSEFGKTKDGKQVDQYVLRNQNGIELKVITYGGRITSLKVPNKAGIFENVILGFDSMEQYEGDNPFFGALIGRYGNRIAHGKFTLDGKEYTLAQNDGPNHLHGGVDGFDRVIWKAEPKQGDTFSQLKLTYLSKDGEEGYPGNLNVTVTYTLNEDNLLDVSYEATSDQTTVVNLTQHAYFNLTGDFSKSILDHSVEINASAYLPVDSTLIPTAEKRKVEGTPFDFKEAKNIGRDINVDNKQLKRGKGYDHCWLLNGKKGNMKFAASAYDNSSGRFMEIYTEEPAIQFYTGNFLDGSLPMPGGGVYNHRTGFCLETQHYPNSPNEESFPSTVLNAGEVYKTKTSFKFSVK